VIPPNLLSSNLFFYAVPIWQWEAVAPPAAAATQDAPCAGDAAATAAASELANAEPASAATAAALRLVFKGYEWRPTVDWHCEAVPEWEQWTDSKRDDSSADARSRERARNAAPLRPAAAPSTDGTPGPAASETGD
jgi:hypothetical protein